jgi:hypothetical protein
MYPRCLNNSYWQYGIAAAEDASELSTFTPAFLWLLRDFYLDLEDEGRKVRSSSSGSNNNNNNNNNGSSSSSSSCTIQR